DPPSPIPEQSAVHPASTATAAVSHDQRAARHATLVQERSSHEAGPAGLGKGSHGFCPPPGRASSGAPEKRMRVDVGTPFMERNLMTVERAMADFLLTHDDLDGLKRTPRRSPYPNSPELLVLSRKDVVQRWGSPEKLVEELQRRIRHASRTASSLGEWWTGAAAPAAARPGPAAHQRDAGIRRLPRDERRRRGEDAEPRAAGLCAASGRVVLAAIVMNGGCMVMKFAAWYYTKSHSMFSEFLHSVADLANQIIIAIGVHTSTKRDPPLRVHQHEVRERAHIRRGHILRGHGGLLVSWGHRPPREVSPPGSHDGECLVVGLLGDPQVPGPLYFKGMACVFPDTAFQLAFIHVVGSPPPFTHWCPHLPLTQAFLVMGVSGLLEVSTLALAVRALRHEASKRNMALSAFGRPSSAAAASVWGSRGIRFPHRQR
ncbi:hypothetical protein FOCC_FOCC005389, partial [Frankliniella occidentalis]